MSEYLTPADLDSLVDAIIAAEAGDRVAQYLLASDGAMSRLLAQARLALTIPEREAQAREEGIREGLIRAARYHESVANYEELKGWAGSAKAHRHDADRIRALLATPEASDE